MYQLEQAVRVDLAVEEVGGQGGIEGGITVRVRVGVVRGCKVKVKAKVGLGWSYSRLWVGI